MARGLDWEAAAKREQARVKREPQVVAWWWVPARYATRCSECSEWTPKGSLIAYSHHLRAALCESCGEKHAPQTSQAAAVRKEPTKPKKERRDPEPRRYRSLRTLSGTVRYVDSGWTEDEWKNIEEAMAKRA